MSGTVCTIIIHGNRLQALMAASLAKFSPNYPPAQYAIGNAQSLCQLGTLTYDSAEVFTDDQKERATVMMGKLNDIAQPIIDSDPDHHKKAALLAAIVEFNAEAEALLAEVVAEPES